MVCCIYNMPLYCMYRSIAIGLLCLMAYTIAYQRTSRPIRFRKSLLFAKIKLSNLERYITTNSKTKNNSNNNNNTTTTTTKTATTTTKDVEVSVDESFVKSISLSSFQSVVLYEGYQDSYDLTN